MTGQSVRCGQCGWTNRLDAGGYPKNSTAIKCSKCGTTVTLFQNETVVGPIKRKGQTTTLSSQFNPPGFEIIRKVGEGGMGVVFEARQLSLNRRVAIKLIPAELASQSDFIERFDREAKVLATLSHPNIVAIFDLIQVSSMAFIVMEYVEGKDGEGPVDLRLLQQKEKLDYSKIRRISLEIARALAYTHSHGIVHRDVKPGNILVDKSGRIKLTDFGIATDTNQRDLHLTNDRSAIGTPNYMAPEQQSDAARVDGRADIYSLGVLLYELLTGSLPRGAFEPPSKIAPGCDPAWDLIVTRALRPDRDSRWPSMDEMARAIEAIGQTKLEKTFADVKCQSCGSQSSPDDEYCRQCGGSLWLECPKCATRTPTCNQYCRKCGLDIARHLKVSKSLETARRDLLAAKGSKDAGLKLTLAENASLVLAKAMRLDPENTMVRQISEEANKVFGGMLSRHADAAYREKKFGTLLSSLEKIEDLGLLRNVESERLKKVRVFRSDLYSKIKDKLESGEIVAARSFLDKAMPMFSDDEEFIGVANEIEVREGTVKSIAKTVILEFKERRMFAVKNIISELDKKGLSFAGLDHYRNESARLVAMADFQILEAEELLSSYTYNEALELIQEALQRVTDHPGAKDLGERMADAHDKIQQSIRLYNLAAKEKRWFLAKSCLRTIPEPALARQGLNKTLATVERLSAGSDRFISLIFFLVLGTIAIVLATKATSLLVPALPSSPFIFGIFGSSDLEEISGLVLYPITVLACLWTIAFLIGKEKNSREAFLPSLFLLLVPVALHLFIVTVGKAAEKAGTNLSNPSANGLAYYFANYKGAVVSAISLWSTISAFSLITLGTISTVAGGKLLLHTFAAAVCAMLPYQVAGGHQRVDQSFLPLALVGLLPVVVKNSSFIRYMAIPGVIFVLGLLEKGSLRKGETWLLDHHWILCTIMAGLAGALCTKPPGIRSGITIVIGAFAIMFGASTLATFDSVPPITQALSTWFLGIGAAASVAGTALDRRLHLLDRIRGASNAPLGQK
jgi:serine/threonine protein kinase